MSNKLNDFHVHINSNNYDLIALCETWLNNNTPNSLLDCNNNFTIVRKDRATRGGGLCLFISKSFTTKIFEVVIPDAYKSLEILAVDLICDMVKTRVILLYRPPGYSYENNVLLVSALEYLSPRNYKVVILGDFNLPSIDWTTSNFSASPQTSCLCEYIQNNGLHQIINFPTREQNILDLVFVSDVLSVYNVTAAPPISSSDHNCVVIQMFFCDVNNASNNVRLNDYDNCHERNFYYCFKRADWHSLIYYLNCIDWITAFASCLSIDDYWQCFYDILSNGIDMFVPKKITGTSSKRRKNIKYPFSIRKLLNKKTSAWRSYSNFRTTTLKANYKKLVSECQNAIKTYSISCENHLIKNGNLGSFYKFVNSKTSVRTGIPPLMNTTGAIISDDFEKAELLNTFFASVFTKDDGILPSNACAAQHNLPHGGICCTPTLVIKAISKMKGSSSSGDDNLPALVYKKIAHYVAFPLNTIFNVSLSTSKIPKAWKSAVVTPVFKKGLSRDPSNYRPISLTSAACKILESIISDNINEHLSLNSLLSKHQHGFLKKRSTTTQLLQCCNVWHVNQASKNQTDVIYLDFAKAFDSVVHAKLLYKLECYGITGLALNWIKEFLSNRTQRVKVGSSLSTYSQVTSGVPQGSILGPLLFLIFINDICDIIGNNVEIKLFADDVKLFFKITDNSSHSKIQSCLDNISQWCNDWQLKISPSKCAVLTIGKKHSDFCYKIDNATIQLVNSFKDLGVTIDNSLDFSEHVNKICATASQRAALILKCFTSRDPALLIRAFTTYVRPLLEFASCIWSPYKLSLIDKIESIQRRFTKKLHGFYNLSYKDRLIKLGIVSLEERRLKADLVMYFKILHNLIDIDSKDFFSVVANNNTRGHPLKLCKPLCTNNSQLYNFKCRAINAWNSLDLATVMSSNASTFKLKLKYLNLCDFVRRV